MCFMLVSSVNVFILTPEAMGVHSYICLDFYELSPVAVLLEADCKAWHSREIGKWHALPLPMQSGSVWAVVADSHHADPALWFPRAIAFL